MVLQAIRYNMLQIRNLKKLKVKKLKEAAIINLFQGFPKKHIMSEYGHIIKPMVKYIMETGVMSKR